MKINNKGYLLVEIVVAFTIAMIMAFFLLQVVIDLKNINRDYYLETKLESDRIIMTKVVMDDVMKYKLNKVERVDNGVLFTFVDNVGTSSTRKLTVIDGVFKYGVYNTSTDRYDKNILTKTFDSSLNLESLTITNKCYSSGIYVSCNMGNTGAKILNIILPAKTNYNDNKDYGLNIFIPY